MKIFRSFAEAASIKNPVVTTGSFDGVHIGHKTILKRLNLLARKYEGESVLITFDPHPRKVLYPETAGKDLKLINSQEEKLWLLEKAGLDNVIIIEFTKEFSRTTSEMFVRDLLHGTLHARVIVVGFNHHFGFNKEGDYKQLWEWQDKYNFEAEEIPEQEVYHETVSSTRIRQAISEGYIQRANAYLDHYYIIKGKPLIGEAKSPQDFSSVYVIPPVEECKILPPPGIYAVSVDDLTSSRKGMVIVHKQLEDKPEVLLVIIDDPAQVPSDDVTISFRKRIHGAVDLSDPKSINKIKLASDEISELIY